MFYIPSEYSKKIILLAVYLLAFLPGTYSQQKDRVFDDVLYLNNGSIIKGKIIYPQVGDTYRVKIFGGSIFAIPSADIDSIKKDSFIVRDRNPFNWYNPNGVNYRDKGFYYVIGLGWNIAEDGVRGLKNRLLSEVNFSFNLTAGKYINKYLNLGLGIGYDNYQKGTAIPLTLDVRGVPWNRPIQPFYYAKGGWSMGIDRTNIKGESFTPGWVYELGVGLKLNTATRHEFMFSAGFREQNVREEFSQWGWDPVNQIDITYNIEGARLYRRLSVQFSWGF